MWIDFTIRLATIPNSLKILHDSVADLVLYLFNHIRVDERNVYDVFLQTQTWSV